LARIVMKMIVVLTRFAKMPGHRSFCRDSIDNNASAH
jgi:hypothetical protein